MKAIVVGAGVSGLAAAYKLQAGGAEVVLLEKSSRAGGVISTQPLGDFAAVEESADAFLGRVPWGIELCEELGLAGDLVSPASAEVLTGENFNSGLSRLSGPHILGVPIDIDSSQIQGQTFFEDLRKDWNRTQISEPPIEQETVGSLVRRRVGDEIFLRQVAPLIGAISASDPDQIGLLDGAPLLAEAAQASMSLMKGLAAASQKASQPTFKPEAESKPVPAFYAPRGGMQKITDTLTERLDGAVKTNVCVTKVAAGRVQVQGGEDYFADCIVLALPTFISKELLANSAPAEARILESVQHASVALVQLVFEAGDLPETLSGIAGILLPHNSQKNVTAISISSEKWSHLNGPVLLRVSIGRFQRAGLTGKSDRKILKTVLAELAQITGIRAKPLAARISRWPNSFPQYEPGHLAKMKQVREQLAEQNLFLAGSAVRGVGVPACIASGIEAGEEALVLN